MERLKVKGKYFLQGEHKFFLQSVCYGPLYPTSDSDTDFLGTLESAERDFKLIQQAGLNGLRIYHTPPKWFLDLAEKYELRIMVTIPWNQRVLFLDNYAVEREIRSSVSRAAHQCSGHPALMGYFIDNEIPPDLVRWYGASRVGDFLDSLVEIVKEKDSSALVSYANFPPTEYLVPRSLDFYSYNIYLHDPSRFKSYLAHLQNIAREKPLVVSEFGMDTLRHTEDEQSDIVRDHFNNCFYGGAAGLTYFSWTDEWFTNGIKVEDWKFGLVDKDRRLKKSYETTKALSIKPTETIIDRYPLKEYPKVSVVVCSYNGGSTLRDCLSSLEKVNYPDYEVVLVDDGSTDDTPSIAKDFPWIHYIRQRNFGLSVARNVGMQAAKGTIVAYTDSDCMVDPDWLYHLVYTFQTSDYIGVGGPNITPDAKNWQQAAVCVAPGSPAHVLLTDTEAEHIPGCNMAFYKSAIEGINGFDAFFRKAGDDVDFCWRLMQAGHKIGFNPVATVWHYRRFDVRNYIKQQMGYGEAEAMLRFKHLHHFESTGTARWRGIIYNESKYNRSWLKPLVYHGTFGTGLFQSIYFQPQSEWKLLMGSFEWIIAATLLLLLSLGVKELQALPLLMYFAYCWIAGVETARARLEGSFDTVKSRLLVFFLSLAQPICRGWARYSTWIFSKRHMQKQMVPEVFKNQEKLTTEEASHLKFWSESGKERYELLEEVRIKLKELGYKSAIDSGWTTWDIQVFADRSWNLRLRSLTEIYPHGRRLTRIENKMIPTSLTYLVGALSLILLFLAPIYVSHMGFLFLLFFYFLGVFIWWRDGIRMQKEIAQLMIHAGQNVGLIWVHDKNDEKSAEPEKETEELIEETK